MIASFVAAGLALVLLLSLPRLLLGPTLYDRALALAAVCIEATLIAAALAAASGRSDWLDASFALVAATVMLAVAMLKFFRVRTFQGPITNAGEAG
jgi:multisubunit Na+/H+ antiporter MnhF subunit